MELLKNPDKTINVVDLTERLQKVYPAISFETVIRGLSNEASQVDDKTREIIFFYAEQLGKD